MIKFYLFFSLFFSSILFANHTQPEISIDHYLDMSLDDLLSVEVSSVSRHLQPLRESAAAIFVINQEDIRRSGATQIPELLRMVPGLNVAQINAHDWAISARGFNGRFANKLLVLMDGRLLYTPTISGVYWDTQNTLLEDIERIEVIRGPGATLWGTNAVNGIINIITKSPNKTQGGLVVIGTGNKEQAQVKLRYGFALNKNTNARAYLQYHKRDHFIDQQSKQTAGDQWDNLQSGFKVEGIIKQAKWRLQGDIYRNNEHLKVNDLPQLSPPFSRMDKDKIKASGWNLTSYWEQQLSINQAINLQLYYDHSERQEKLFGKQTDNIFDLDFQYHLKVNAHQIITGLGYRQISDHFEDTYLLSSFTTAKDNRVLFNAFIQDDIQLSKKLRLTLGSKFEHNDYTGLNIQPNIRLLWIQNSKITFWGAISKATRTPSRHERTGKIITLVKPRPNNNPPLIISVNGSPSFQDEDINAYEFGYRHKIANHSSIDLSLFYNSYKKIRSIDGKEFPNLFLANNIEGHSKGLELAAHGYLNKNWSLKLAYSYVKISLQNKEKVLGNAPDFVGFYENSTPHHQLSLRSQHRLTSQIDLSIWLRYIDKVPMVNPRLPQSIPAYHNLDLKVAWRPNKQLEVAIVGKNLLNPQHLEFIPEPFGSPIEIERSLYAQLKWNF